MISRLSLLVSTISMAGCTIIVQAGGPDPVPVPIPAPLVCAPTGEAPTAHIFFDVRVERTTANLIPAYARFMQATALGLAAAKIVPTEAALVRLDERPVSPAILAAWGCNLDDPETLSPEMVLEHYAKEAAPPASPVGCATDPLTTAGANLTELVTQYPQELPGTSGLHMFSYAPKLALVIHIDERARRTAYDEAPCDGSHVLAKTNDGMASWLNYKDGIAADHVFHWFVTTEEGMDRESFLAACKAYEGFPSDALDVIDASDKALYGPLASEIGSSGAGVAKLPLCAMLVETELASFLNREIRSIAEFAGTSIDEAALARILAGGGLPNIDPSIEPGR